MIQAVLFKNDKWQPQEAVRWLIENEHKATDMVVSEEFPRFNQIPEQGHTDYHNKNVGRGIYFVIASKPQQPISNFR